jgi:hypothetical protein
VQSCVISEVFRRINTVRRVVYLDLSVIGFFISFFEVLFEKFLLPILMELAPSVSGVILYCIL